MAVQEISKADRIRELNDINADIPAMLQAAGQAINALTNRSLTVGEDGDTHMGDNEGQTGLDERKEAFADATREYYTHLQAISVRLKRQVYALEEAGIIGAKKPAAIERENKAAVASVVKAKPQSGRETQQNEQKGPQKGTRIWNSGLGDLDIGWMNSRTNKVGAEKEQELMEEARVLLSEELERRQLSKGG